MTYPSVTQTRELFDRTKNYLLWTINNLHNSSLDRYVGRILLEINMFGYMTAKEAVANGFTHHGKYFGIPIWVAPDKGFMVATKWAPMEYVMTAAHVVEGLLRSVFHPDDEPAFQFLLGDEIDAGA